MPEYKSVDVIYVGDEYVADEETALAEKRILLGNKYVTDEEIALAEKSVLLIKSYEIIKDDQCYIIIMTTIDDKTIGPCMMSYDTFDYLFIKGYVADAAYKV